MTKIQRTTVFLVLFLTVITAGWAQTVKIVQDANGGWEMLVDNKQFFVKGVVWAVNPPGTSHWFNLWDESDRTIRKVLDIEGAQMAEAGINAMRVGGDIPRKWVEYMYNKHGIYTIIQDGMSRWGASANGRYYFPTNYYVQGIRDNVIKTCREILERHKDTTGLLLYMFGDGNGHGFYWPGDDNAPDVVAKYGVDPRFRKARSFFSLLEEVCSMAKEIDPYRPVGYLGNDLGWIELIAEECPSIDFLGVNLGGDWGTRAAGDKFWADAREKLDKPIIMGSIGILAWNPKTDQEDQYSQLDWTASLWEDIYQNAYGKGQSNALGGCVSEWADQWYKNDYDFGTAPQIWEHDTLPTGTNPGYSYSHVDGQRNMSPEWGGITAQGQHRYISWFTQKMPRAAYYALQHIWSVDPWALNPKAADLQEGANASAAGKEAVQEHFKNLDVGKALARGLMDGKEMRPEWKVTNNVNVVMMQSGDDILKAIKRKEGDRDNVQWAQDAKDEKKFEPTNIFQAFNQNQWGVELATSFWGIAETGTYPGNYLEGGVTLWTRHDMIINTINDVGDLDLRAGPVTSKIFRNPVMGMANRGPIDIYQAYFTWKNRGLAINGYYHRGKGNWLFEGDFFNLATEKWDLYSDDLWEIKSPVAVEASYDFGLPGKTGQGLSILAGPKIYAGAKPMVLAKWFHAPIDKQGVDENPLLEYSVMVSQEFSVLQTELGDWGTEGVYSDPKTTAALYVGYSPFRSFGWLFKPSLQLQFGALGTNFQKIGDKYFRRGEYLSRYGTDDADDLYNHESTRGLEQKDEIKLIDTLSFKLRASYNTGKYISTMAEVLYAGLVADTNWVPFAPGSVSYSLWSDSGAGNRLEGKAGISGAIRGINLTLNALYRRPMKSPVSSRWLGSETLVKYLEPFKVGGGNRETIALELLLGYDTQPATWIWEWNVWDVEGAKFATRFKGRVDVWQGAADPGARMGADGKLRFDYEGYPETWGNFDLGWMVFYNPKTNLRFANSLNFTRGNSWNGIYSGLEKDLYGNIIDSESLWDRVNVFGWSEELRIRYERLIFKTVLAFGLWGPAGNDREFNRTYPFLWSFDIAYSFSPRPSLMDSINRVGFRWNGVIRDRWSPNASDGKDSQELILYFNFTF